MEGSSPLAALQPKKFQPSFGIGPYSRPKGNGSFVPKLGLSKPLKDIPKFDLDAFMDSTSPTTELVLDLSQNFHIDKTPKAPTPRRSLFTNFTFEKEKKLSIPMPSSPSPAEDEVDPAPLPHKPSHSSLFDSPAISPTTEAPEDVMLCSSPPPPVTARPAKVAAPDAPRKPSFIERKKSCSLTRQPFRTKSGNIFKNVDKPAFSLSSMSKSTKLELEQLFGYGSPQPVKEKKLGPAFCPDIDSTPTIPKFSPKENNRNSLDSSPVAVIQRRPTARNKFKFRRTMSMYENTESITSENAGARTPPPPPPLPLPKLSPIVDSPASRCPGEEHALPCHTVKDDPLRRIKKSVLIDVLNDKYKEYYDEYMIVDCRFDYEYEGGHVAGAININTPEALEKRFFAEPVTKKILIIFHCEFSACRAPRMAMNFRNLDRQANMHRYPVLSYPDIYILEGGYSGFFGEFKQRCEPQQYVEMDHAAHRQVRERELGKFRRNAKMGRSQTYHFGSQKHDANVSSSGLFGKRSLSYNTAKDEGTANSRTKPSSNSKSGSNSKLGSRRLASY